LGEDTYKKLWQLNENYPLNKLDFHINCLNEDYQHISLVPGDYAIWQRSGSIKEKILEAACPVKTLVRKSLGIDFSLPDFEKYFNEPLSNS
jgi:hypothetical protein